MKTGEFVFHYVVWHYTQALTDLFRIVLNYLWCVKNYFSIDLLLRTFFAPWKRLEDDGGDANSRAGAFLSRFIISLFTRLVGVVVRAVAIVIGVVMLLVTMFLGVIAFVIWFILPLVILSLFVYSIFVLIG